MLPLTLSFDHGVIDGAPAARFVATLRDLTETAAAFEQTPERTPLRPETHFATARHFATPGSGSPRSAPRRK
jgi:hypothetical protein